MVLYTLTVLQNNLNFHFRYTRLFSASRCSSGTHCSNKNISTKTLYPTSTTTLYPTSTTSTSIPTDELSFPAHTHSFPTSIISFGKPATINISYSRPATADSHSNRQWIPTTRTHSKWFLSVQALRRCLSIICGVQPAELMENECAMNTYRVNGKKRCVHKTALNQVIGEKLPWTLHMISLTIFIKWSLFFWINRRKENHIINTSVMALYVAKCKYGKI